MSRIKSTRLLVITSCLLLLGLVASARGQRGQGTLNENTEVLLGSHTCSVSFDPPEAFAFLSFEASGDVFPHTPSLYRSFKGDSATPETCDALLAASAGILEQASCSVGSIEVFGDESFTSRDFRFVCHARRSEIISLIAEVSKQQLIATP